MPQTRKPATKSSRKRWAKPASKKKNKEATAPLEEKRPRRTMERVIVDLCIADESGRGIDPVSAAKAFAEDRHETDPLAWRKWLQQVRSTAVGMARKGDLLILRKGEPADPETFKGVYRLGLPEKE
jgi:hypothetical protein